MKIIIYTTNDYPYYEKEVITVRGKKKAEAKFDEIGAEITKRIRNGLLQDAMIELCH